MERWRLPGDRKGTGGGGGVLGEGCDMPAESEGVRGHSGRDGGAPRQSAGQVGWLRDGEVGLGGAV